LKLNKSISNFTNNLSVFYNHKQVDANTITISEDILEFIVPEDAESGNIHIKSGENESNTIPFVILSSVTTPLISQSVSPSSTEQVISYKDEVVVTIPQGILDTTRNISISTVSNAPPNLLEPFGSNAIDVTIDGLEQLNDFIEISVKYDPNRLNSDYSATEQLLAMRWDDSLKIWIPLSYNVDEINHMVNITTDHLCVISVTGLAGAAIFASGISTTVTWAGEQLLNDIYPDELMREILVDGGDFRIFYNKSNIQNAMFSDEKKLSNQEWINFTYAPPVYPITYNEIKDSKTGEPRYPYFIQDMYNILEIALKSYIDTNKFKDPRKGLIWGNNPINVKIDSWYLRYRQYQPLRDPLFGYIHYPTEALVGNTFLSGSSSYGIIGHELFHTIQGEYYSFAEMMAGSHKWWIEATANYAGYRAAWPDKKLDSMHEVTGADFFHYPISTTGEIEGGKNWGPEAAYEYAASAFIQFLVENKGLNFKDMVEYVASGSPLYTPLEMLNGYNGINLAQYYREFAAWGIFHNDSFLEKHSIYTISEQNDEILVPKDSSGKFSVSVSGANEGIVDIYVDFSFSGADQNQKLSEIPVPDYSIGNQDKYEINAEIGYTIFLLASNSGGNDETITVSVKMIGDQNEDGKNQDIEKKYTFILKGGYTAKLWTIEVKSSDTVFMITPEEISNGKADEPYTFQFTAENIPSTTKKVYFEFDFGDYQSHSSGLSEVITVSNGKAELSLSHTYMSGRSQCTIKGSVKDFATDNKLAEAEAKIYFNTVTIQGERIINYELSSGQNMLEHDFEAIAAPDGIYRFDWDFGDGNTFSEIKQSGERSKLSHIYTGLNNGDTFNPQVKIYNQAGEFLANDIIALHIEQTQEYVCNGNAIDYSKLEKLEGRNSLYYCYLDDNGLCIRHGLFQVWDENNLTQLLEQLFYCNGKKEGTSTVWYENGNKKEEGSYTNDKKNGLWTTWYDNGNKNKETTYLNDIKEGHYVEYYEDGDKRKEGNYTNNFEKNGLWTYWRYNGTKIEEGSYTNNKKNGLWTTWYDNGNKNKETTYLNDIKEGMYTAWHENGNVDYKGYYTNGRKTGVWRHWDGDGKCVSIYDYDSVDNIYIPCPE
ncbi:MAG: toxin-antitoxin system YwqK family antitoxin, partial [Desulfamplus sp.]|nr:toxin-antitoxin system YwqK family antitoxin [Desulfamplus sp.]